MRLSSTALTATGMLGVLSAVLATATLWMLLTDPVTVATTVDGGNISSMLHAIATAMRETFAALLRYL